MTNNRIRELRRAHGLSQQELADATGLSRDTISFTETGRRDPAPSTVKTLADFFGVPRPYLMGFDLPKQERTGTRT